jgi:hypothetical protein
MTTRISREDYDNKEELIRRYEFVVEWVKTATIKDMVNVIADAHQPKGKEELESSEVYPYAFNRAQQAIEQLIDVVLGEDEDRPDV